MDIKEQLAVCKQPPADWSTIGLWLGIATRGLSAEAKARIHQEYTAHFEDAIRVKTEDGFAGCFAEWVVLLELGSPYKARRSLRATNLTELEAYFLALTEERPTPITLSSQTAILSFSVLCFAAATLGVASAPWADVFSGGFHIMLLYLGCGALPYALAATLQRRQQQVTRAVARVIACAQLAIVAVILSFCVEQTIWDLQPVGPFDSSSPAFFVHWFLALLASYEARRMWQLQKKLPYVVQRAKQ